MHRRNFIRNSAGLLGSIPLMNMPFTFYDNPDVHELNVGDFKCTIFRDTMFKYLGKDFFINASEQEATTELARYRMTADNIPSPFIALLIESADRKILVDTGAGYTDKPIIVRGKSVMLKGKLRQLLSDQNIKGEDITDVVITHFHPDHIGGINPNGGKLDFPNAKFHMHRDEWDYWHGAASANQPEQFRIFIDRNITRLKNLNLNLFKGDYMQIVPGVTAVEADGHTPGQVAIMVHSKDERMLYISDAFLHPLHIEHLGWQTNYDLDHEKARRSRIKLLDLAHKENMLINAFHFEFPGIGRAEKHKEQWKWNVG